jgi:ABC-type transporter Mla MlaB component
MFDFKLTREPEATVLDVSGAVIGDEDRDLLNETFAFVQPDDNLILDLSDLNALDPAAAILLHDVLMRRSIMAESVIVSGRPGVSMQLVLHDVDRVCPIVSNVDSAIDILDRPWPRRRLPR